MYRSLAAAVRDAEAQGISLSRLALATEADDQGRPVEEIRDVLRRALYVMQGAIAQGLTGTFKSASGLVGGDAAKLAGATDAPVAGGAFRDVLARALALAPDSAPLRIDLARAQLGQKKSVEALATLADAPASSQRSALQGAA